MRGTVTLLGDHSFPCNGPALQPTEAASLTRRVTVGRSRRRPAPRWPCLCSGSRRPASQGRRADSARRTEPRVQGSERQLVLILPPSFSPPARCASGRAGTGAPGTFLGVHLRGGASHRAQTPPAPRGPGPPPPPDAAPAGKGPVRAADGRRPPTPGTAGAPQPPAGPPRPARSGGRSGGGAGLLFLAAAAEAHGVAAAQTASSSAVAAEEEAGEEG